MENFGKESHTEAKHPEGMLRHGGKFFSCCLLMFLLTCFLFFGCTEPGDDTKPGVTNAKQPNITAQPAGGFWNVFLEDNDTFDLTVTANITDGGSPSYQWYSNTSNSATGGTPIATGGTNENLSLNKNSYTANGTRYFYVVVTNTNNAVKGTKTASTTSAVAEVVIVGNPDTDYTTSPMPEELKGTWTYDWGGGFIEKYIVDETTFTSEYTYAGTIVGHRSNNDGDGYITIKFTENSGYVDSENKFYVIHYKDLSISEVTFAGAYLGADPDFEYGVGPGGKTTRAEAEAVITVSAGYFGMYSILDKEGYTNADHPHISPQPAGGNWNVSANNTFTLTVSANIDDGGELTYQWYRNNSNSNSGGDSISANTTTASHQLEKASYTINGTYFFYVIVTNTNNSVNGNKTVATTSDVVTVTVSGNSGGIADAQTPSITTQPTGGEWNIDEHNSFQLTVAAHADGGALTYKWYSNTGSSNSGGTAITEATTDHTLTLNKANYTANGNYYFYAEVINTNDSATGNKTATATSNVATVTISGNSVAFQLPAEFIGIWDGGYDFNIFEAPDIMWNTWDMSSVWIKVQIMEIATLGDEMLLYGRFIEMADGSDGGYPFGTIGSGEYSAIYINKISATKMEILQLALEGENSAGYSYGQPMYETLEAAKAGLPLNSSFRDTYVSYPVTYTKQ